MVYENKKPGYIVFERFLILHIIPSLGRSAAGCEVAGRGFVA
jgi:hypothetical protein